MSSEPLKIIATANAEISAFLSRASIDYSRHNQPDPVWPAISSDLPAIAAAVEKAGVVVGHLTSSENLDTETREQLGLYTKNLQSLKSILSRLLVAAQEERKRLADNTGKAYETMSWLKTLQSTEID